MTTGSPRITTISKDHTYHGWPTVCRRADGELLVVSSSGRDYHVCPYGKVRLQRSQDDGQTWSAPEVLVDGPLDDRDAGVIETSRGTLIVSWFTSLAWMWTLCRHEMGAQDWLPHEERENWCAERDRIIRDVDVRAVHGEYVIRSTDDGRTWSEPIPTGVSTPHGPIELDDGTLLYLGKAHAPYEKWDSGSTLAGMPITTGVSHDDGLTWENVGEVPVVEGQGAGNYFEPHAVQAPDGRLLVHIRNRVAWPKENTWQSESFDGGRTWSVPRELPFGNIAHPAHLLRLRDGRILSTFGCREEPFGNRASVSDDCGQTWSEPFVVSEDGSNRDLGYPSTVEMTDGGLLSVWYEKRDDVPKATLRQASWRLP